MQKQKGHSFEKKIIIKKIYQTSKTTSSRISKLRIGTPCLHFNHPCCCVKFFFSIGMQNQSLLDTSASNLTFHGYGNGHIFCVVHIGVRPLDESLANSVKFEVPHIGVTYEIYKHDGSLNDLINT